MHIDSWRLGLYFVFSLEYKSHKYKKQYDESQTRNHIFFNSIIKEKYHLDGLVEVSDDSLEVDGDEGIAKGGGLRLGMAPKINADYEKW